MKDQILKFRVTDIEVKLIKYKAKKAGLDVSEFLRRLAFEKEIRARLTPEEIKCYHTLIEYANNFRRIANLIKKNDQKQLKKEVLETAELIKKHLEKLK